MTIEEDFEQVRECLIGIYGKDPHAALDRIEGYIEQCADFQRAAETERDALKEQVERLRAGNAALADQHNRESHGVASHEALAYHDVVKERDALKAALEREQVLHEEHHVADLAWTDDPAEHHGA